jgi:hypothetical protein
MSVSYGYAVGDEIDINGGNWSTSSTGRKFRLKELYTHTNGYQYAIWERNNNPTLDVKYGFTVKWDGSVNQIGVEWNVNNQDQGNQEDPACISLGQSSAGSRSDAIVIPSNNTTDIWMYDNNQTPATDPDIILTWNSNLVWSTSSGSGSGGGGGFLSNNPLIENVYFAKNSDSSIALGFDWENISSYKVWVDRAGTITTHELFLTGSSGSITGYTGSGANALNNLGEGDKVWLTRGNNDDTIVDGYGSIGNPYSHQIVVWSKDSEKVYAKCFGDVTFSGGQSSAGTKATRLRGGKSYGSYESPTTNEITHELPRGLGKYQIELWTTTSGNPTSYVDYGSFFRDSSQVTCNFW